MFRAALPLDGRRGAAIHRSCGSFQPRLYTVPVDPSSFSPHRAVDRIPRRATSTAMAGVHLNQCAYRMPATITHISTRRTCMWICAHAIPIRPSSREHGLRRLARVSCAHRAITPSDTHARVPYATAGVPRSATRAPRTLSTSSPTPRHPPDATPLTCPTPTRRWQSAHTGGTLMRTMYAGAKANDSCYAAHRRPGDGGGAR